jgi:phosphatidylglycerol---prolipoprotein diacylglyceryl transferase
VYPVLFRLGHYTFYTYGLFVALAILTAGFVTHRLLRARGLPPEFAFELVIAATVGGFVGARLYWVAQHTGMFKTHGLSMLIMGAGFTWYGGLIGGVVAVVLLARLRKLPLGTVANIMAPAVAVGYAVGRIACQFAGDGTYGRPSGLPWAMAYPRGMMPTIVRVQPTPVYETLAMTLVFVFLYRMARREQPGWLVFGWFLLLSGLERLLIEFLRTNRVWELGLTAPQWFGLLSMTAGIALIARLKLQRSSMKTATIVR